MFLARWSGKVTMALVVIALACWATHQKLLNIPTSQFWAIITGYLAAAEGLWIWWDRRHAESEFYAPRGLSRLTGQTKQHVRPAEWFFAGGRPRLLDIQTGADAPREYLAGLLSSVTAAEGAPRVHLLVGPLGSGRSTLLLRLGQHLADRGHTVIRTLPGPNLDALDVVLRAARARRPAFLLIDDLDLLPQAQERLHVIMRSGRPVVVVGTAIGSVERERNADMLDAQDAADLLTPAIIHDVQFTAKDVNSLITRLRDNGRLKQLELPPETAGHCLSASNYLQGAPLGAIWEQSAVRDLPEQPKTMLALAGAAELALPVSLFASLIGPTKVAAWQRAGVVAVDGALVLPPHQSVCLAYLLSRGEGSTEARQSLARLVDRAAAMAPRVVPRLLYGLSRNAALRSLATDTYRASIAAGVRLANASQRAVWLEIADAFGDPIDPTAVDAQDAPGQWRLARNLANHGQHEAALEVYARYADSPVYADLARINCARALARLGRLEEAERQLGRVQRRLPGVRFLGGVIAEMRNDLVRAMDCYEESRKDGELVLPATRRLAFIYLRTGAPRAAIPMFEALLSHTPQRADLYGGLAVAHLQTGTGQRAVAQSARAIQAGVDPVVARKAVARALRQANAFERMAAELEAVVSYDADDDDAWSELAEACRLLGRFRREEQCLSQVRRCRQADAPEVIRQLARCYRDQGRPGEALTILQQLLTRSDAPADLYVQAAEAACSADQPEVQRDLSWQAIQMGDTTGWAHFWWAESLPGDAQGVAEAYQRAIQLLSAQQAQGASPPVAARLWEAIRIAAVALGQTDIASQALQRARQEAAVCRAVGSEIESPAARRSVPAEVFLHDLEATPPDDVPDGAGGSELAVGPESPAVSDSQRVSFLQQRLRNRGAMRG